MVVPIERQSDLIRFTKNLKEKLNCCLWVWGMEIYMSTSCTILGARSAA